MITCYNFAHLIIKHAKADSIAIKTVGIAVKVYDVVNGEVDVDTTDWIAGQYSIQFFLNDQVIDQDILIVNQNLKHTDANYDPRSNAQKILEAIDAYLAGTATHQQRKVKVGQKQIEYSSYDQLIKWRNFYAKQVAKELGKPTQIRHQKLYYRGV